MREGLRHLNLWALAHRESRLHSVCGEFAFEVKGLAIVGKGEFCNLKVRSDPLKLGGHAGWIRQLVAQVVQSLFKETNVLAQSLFHMYDVKALQRIEKAEQELRQSEAELRLLNSVGLRLPRSST